MQNSGRQSERSGVMRALLAISSVDEVSPATATTAVVLAIVSMAVLVPAMIICGICEESKPHAAPTKNPVLNHNQGVSGKQSTASSGIPTAAAAHVTAPDATLHQPQASAFDQQPRPTGAMSPISC